MSKKVNIGMPLEFSEPVCFKLDRIIAAIKLYILILI